jgi:hypothetical protein
MRRIWRRIWLGGAAALALAGCQTANPYAGAPASAHNDERIDESSSEDMFILRIDVGRTAIFNDRIATAMMHMQEAAEPEPATEAARAGAELRDATASLRSVALTYLRLEGEACAEGKFADIACKGGEVPAWVFEPASTRVPAAEVQRRLEWLQERMGPLLDAACEKGKTAVPEDEGGGPMFCSVE